MFELFGRYEFEVVLDTKDNQNLPSRLNSRMNSATGKNRYRLLPKSALSTLKYSGLIIKQIPWARVPSKASIGRVSVFALNFNRASNPPPIVLEQMTAPIALRIQETTIYVLKCSSGWIKVGSGSSSSPIWMSRAASADTETARTEQPSEQRGQAVLF